MYVIRVTRRESHGQHGTTNAAGQKNKTKQHATAQEIGPQ